MNKNKYSTLGVFPTKHMCGCEMHCESFSELDYVFDQIK